MFGFRGTTFVYTLLPLAIGVCAGAGQLPRGEVLYYEETSRGKGNLVLLDVETREKRQVGQSGSRSDHFPSWSADGARIVFESYRRGGWHVWVSNWDGTDSRRLSDLPDNDTGSYEFDPAFAPDSETVVFVQGDDLWTVTLDRASPRRVTPRDNGVWETAPVFSPDGKAILVAGRDDVTRQWNLYLVRGDGSGLARLTDGASHDIAPQWSPDGEHILFYSDRGGSFELHEMTRSGRDVRPIFDAAQLRAAGFVETAYIDPWDGDFGATDQYRAGYAPDGEWIVFSRDVAGDRELFVSRRDGSAITRLTHRDGLDAQPSWRPGTR